MRCISQPGPDLILCVQLGDTLSGDSCGVILDAMQVQQGTITLEQFLTIVEVCSNSTFEQRPHVLQDSW